MSEIVQVNVDIMSRQFKIGAPAEEKETLVQAIDLLNQKIATVKEAGKNCRKRQNSDYGRAQCGARFVENDHAKRFGNRRV